MKDNERVFLFALPDSNDERHLSGMIDFGALLSVLCAKGLVSHEEYADARTYMTHVMDQWYAKTQNAVIESVRHSH